MVSFSNTQMLIHGKTTEVEATVSEELIEFWEGQGKAQYPYGNALPFQINGNTIFVSGARTMVTFATTNGALLGSRARAVYDPSTGVWRHEK